MANEELLPCPFCGSAAKMNLDGGSSAWVDCPNAECFVQPIASSCFNKSDAASLWNLRSSLQGADTVTEAMIEAGARQLYKDYESTTDDQAALIFASNASPECRALADEMRQWFAAAMRTAAPTAQDDNGVRIEVRDDDALGDGSDFGVTGEWWGSADHTGVLVEALEGLVAEFEKFSRYGSPIARGANEAMNRAKAALVTARGEQSPDASGGG